jgi:hypothetical protein
MVVQRDSVWSADPEREMGGVDRFWDGGFVVRGGVTVRRKGLG